MRSILVVVLIATVVSALTERERARMAMQNPDLFQGDILGFEPGDRNVIPYEFSRWTKGEVPYEIDISLFTFEPLILRAMKHIEDNSCIKFVPRTTQTNYIRLFKGVGCYSYVGMLGEGEQPVSLGTGCHYKGTIIHELGHALGFFHEQNRSDRDKYLTIYWENIEKGAETQFFLLKPDENLLLTPFDYDSMMIYGNYAFSKDDSSKTMVAKNGQKLTEPYDKPGLSESDVKRLKEMYKC